MHWTTPEQEMPKWCQQVVVETKEGQKAVAIYRPEFKCPWIIEFCRSEDGSMVCFYAQIPDVKAWANIDAYEEDLDGEK